jgi:thymidylate synthase
MSTADINYVRSLKKIIEKGSSNEGQKVRPKWQDGTPAYTKAIFGVDDEYDLLDGVPIHTLRPTVFKNCVDEILWIWQMKSNNVHALNSKIWDQWADETGSIGKAYGYQLRQKHIFPEGEVDQVDHVLYSLKNNPSDRGGYYPIV